MLLKRGEKARFLCIRKRITILAAAFFLSGAAFANPVLDHVAAGQVTVQQVPNSTTVNQTSQRAIINWQSFNIGAQESTHFQQPAGGVAFNRINPTQGPSSVYGRLTATGQIILSNPAGIYFGASAYVNVGGLIATTSGLSDQDFLNGYYNFTKVSPLAGRVVNEGQIIAADHGLVALMGNGVQNDGSIQANMGKVVLASGNAFTMNFAGNELISFTIDEKATSGVTNTGTLSANGGTIMVSAKTAAGVLDNVINMEGFAEAKSINEYKGQIIISGDEDTGIVEIAGTLRAPVISVRGYNILLDGSSLLDATDSAVVFAEHATVARGVINASLANGFVETSAKYYLDVNGVQVHARTWLLDPADITIDVASDDHITNGSPFTATAANAYLDVATLVGALGVGDVIVMTTDDGFAGNGDIIVNTPILWHTSNSLTLSAFRNITSNSAITNDGNASVVLRADNTGTGTGTVSFSAGNVDLSGGTGTVAIYYNPTSFGTQDTIYTGGTTPTQYMLVNDVNALQSVGSYVNQNFALGRDIDASATSGWNSGEGFVPIFDYTGYFDGQNYTISDLTIDRPSESLVGLFGLIGSAGRVSNIALDNADVTGHDRAGILVGSNSGTVTNASTAGTMFALYSFGGFAGENTGTGTLTDVHNTANLSSTWCGNGCGNIGGLVGANNGTINGTSYNTGIVASQSEDNVGGLIGGNGGTLAGTLYNLGNVSAGTYSGSLGGLIGSNGGTINGTGNNFYVGDNSHLVTVTGGANTGGFVGRNGGSISNITLGDDVVVIGTSQVGGFVGVNAGSLTNVSSFAAVTGITNVGGLIGWNQSSALSGTISSMGNVTGTSSRIGGLIGANFAAIDGTGNTITVGNITITATGASSVGGFIGFAGAGAHISNFDSSAIGFTNLSGGSSVGGFVGVTEYGSGTNITNVHTTVSVTATGNNAGGLVGSSNHGTISDSSSTGTVNGAGNVGGLIGLTYVTNVENSYHTTGAVSGSGNNVGGLVGQISNGGTYTSNYNTATVSGVNNVGGLLGYNSGGVITGTSYNANTGTVTGTGSAVGGLIGYNGGVLSGTLYNNANIVANGASNVGGLLGSNYAAIDGTGNAITVGNITISATGASSVGGFIGFAAQGAHMSNFDSSAIGFTNLSGGSSVGGFVGTTEYGSGTNITNVHMIMNVTATGNNAGGLVGQTVHGTVSNSSSTGTVNGADNVGGLIGLLGQTNVANSYHAIGNVSGDTNVGGLIGMMDSGSIANSYSTSVVMGNDAVGGLVGGTSIGSNSITNSYHAGYISGTSNVGGIVGNALAGTRTDNYFDMETTGLAASAGCGNSSNCSGVTGETTSAMMQQATFSGWTFDSSNWGIIENQSYPYLTSIYTTTPRVISGTSSASAGASIQLIVDGVLTNTISAGANGFYYILKADGAIADGANLLTFIDNDAVVGNAIALARSGGDSTSMNIVSDAVTYYHFSGASSINNTNFNNAYYSDADVLYNASSNLTLNNAAYTLRFNVASGSLLTYSGIYAGGGSLAKYDMGTLTLSGNNTFTGATSVVDAGSLAISSANALNTSSGITLDSGIIRSTSSFTLSPNITLTSNGGAINVVSGTLTTSGTINGAGALVLAGSGTLRLSGAVGGVTPVSSLTSSVDTIINTSSGIISSGAQTYNNPVTLSTTTGLNSSAGNGVITFNDTLNGGQTFSVNSGSGDVYFNDAVGTGTALALLQSTGSGNVTFGGAVGDSSHRLSGVFVQGDAYINGGSVYTNNSQSYNGDVFLGANTTLQSSLSSIFFAGAVNSVTTNRSLTLNGATTTTLSSGAGDILPLLSLTTNASGSTVIGGNVTTVNGQTYNDSVTLNNNVTLTSSNASILMAAVNNNGYNFTIDTPSSTYSRINGVVSGSGDLIKEGAGDLELRSTGTYTGNTYVNNGALLADGVDNAFGTVGSITVASGATLYLSDATITNALTLSGNGDGVNYFSALEIDGPSTSTIDGDITLAGDTTIASYSAQLIINGTVNGAHALTLEGDGGIDVYGDVGLTSALTSLSSTNPYNNFYGAVGDSSHRLGVINMSGNTGWSGDVYTSGAQTYQGGVYLLTNDLEMNANNSAVTFGSTIDGGYALAINAGTGAITLNGAIGGIEALSSFSADNSAGTSNITLANAINTTGNVTIASGGTLTVNAPINSGGGNISLTANNPTLNATVLFINDVLNSGPGTGGLLSLSGGLSLTASPVVGAGNITLQGNGNDLTLGTLNFANSIAFEVNRYITVTGSLTTSGGANLTLHGDYDNDNVGGVVLQAGSSIDSSGNLTIIGSALGGYATIDPTAGIEIQSGVTPTSVGSQTYTGKVALGSGVSFTQTGSGNTIAFSAGVSGNQDLNLIATGSGAHAFTINGPLAVNNLTVTGSSSGTNTLTLNTGAAQTWTLAGVDAGTISATGVAGAAGFSQMQSLVGGSANDNYVFQDNARISGSIDGAGGTNTLDYSAYTSPLTVNLYGDNTIVNNSQVITTIADPANFGNLYGSTTTASNQINFQKSGNAVTVDGPAQGSINDPIVFLNFAHLAAQVGGTTVAFVNVSAQYDSYTGVYMVGGMQMYFTNISSFSGLTVTSSAPQTSSSSVASIIQQPVVNNSYSNSTATLGSPTIENNVSDSSGSDTTTVDSGDSSSSSSTTTTSSYVFSPATMTNIDGISTNAGAASSDVLTKIYATSGGCR